ncbi:hypothetical protein KCU85_g8674, partial [Aureobasidium melanogenum]
MAETMAVSGVKRKRNLFDDEGLSDVIIKIRSKQIFAHKAILANGSVWFERAFLGRFVEANKDVIELHEDASITAVMTMFKHLYGLNYEKQETPSHITNFVEFHLEVFILGDKYDISNLRVEAAEKFIRAVQEETQPRSILGIQDQTIQKRNKTYSSRDSHVVTHRSTNLPFNCLCMAERTGCPVFS